MTIVGIIRSVKEAVTKIEYFIDDMTGPPLDVRQFVDNDVSKRTSAGGLWQEYHSIKFSLKASFSHLYFQLSVCRQNLENGLQIFRPIRSEIK